MHTLQIVISAMAVLLSGCISFPHDQKPSFPASIPASQFQKEAEEQLSAHGPEQYRVSIVHAAIPAAGHKGLYVYLLITANPPTSHLQSVASMFGRVFSTPEESEQFVQVFQDDGREIGLQRMQYPSDFHIGFRTISYRKPWCEPVDGYANRAVVQLCMWRVADQLFPGTYRSRLMEPQPDHPYHGFLWKSEGGTSAVTDWISLAVDYQAIRE